MNPRAPPSASRRTHRRNGRPVSSLLSFLPMPMPLLMRWKAVRGWIGHASRRRASREGCTTASFYVSRSLLLLVARPSPMLSSHTSYDQSMASKRRRKVGSTRIDRLCLREYGDLGGHAVPLPGLETENTKSEIRWLQSQTLVLFAGIQRTMLMTCMRHCHLPSPGP